MATPTPAQAPEETLRVAMLLSGVGGFLDAFTWVGHGGVFAGAQTGNIVLLGVNAATGHWAQALRHVSPIGAFVVGVLAAHLLHVHDIGRGTRRAPNFSLMLELSLLLLVAFLPPSFPDRPIVLGIAFVAAVQISSFSRVQGEPYSSVFATNNLRRTAEALFAGVSTLRDPKIWRRAGVFLSVIVSFGLGAAGGAMATARFFNLALLAPAALLVAALALCLRRKT